MMTNLSDHSMLPWEENRTAGLCITPDFLPSLHQNIQRLASADWALSWPCRPAKLWLYWYFNLTEMEPHLTLMSPLRDRICTEHHFYYRLLVRQHTGHGQGIRLFPLPLAGCCRIEPMTFLCFQLRLKKSEIWAPSLSISWELFCFNRGRKN